jgi:hypothetical protein
MSTKQALETAAKYLGHDWHGVGPDGTIYFCETCLALADLLTRFAASERLSEARWWSGQRECVYTLDECQHDRRIAALERTAKGES